MVQAITLARTWSPRTPRSTRRSPGCCAPWRGRTPCTGPSRRRRRGSS
uniref:Uncharacterized protein n=1 Tax=Arundo donax TaxID=35708 RepID=A0A0A9ELF5_ARUDO